MPDLAALDGLLIDGIEKNLRSFVKEHLDDGIDPNLRYDDDPFGQGRPLLTFAAMHGHVQIIKLLLQYGANVNGSDFHGRTALSWAAEFCQYGAVKFLVEHGANVNAEDAECSTPLSWLIHAGNDSSTILTCNDIKSQKTSQRDEGGAVNGRDLEKTRKYLVSKGAKEKLFHSPRTWLKSFYEGEIKWIKFMRARKEKPYWWMCR
jgi:ankyrin repeat protein